ncbi:Uncharacterised nucleotidyltransferase [Sphingomonas sp. YR710]|uniref:nucleotidyltransferase domain-containing protein n=1 Tax=Sphingomonas sp. YR710 TaxID=1882773 RepID=UPI00088A4B8E|nr:nucleotidyltransferase family protein [Sphingomonas sp. YR710]SDC87417.1 Uncharacterised nucleotidyltransferase [Sphingomonas sp. YR710]
MKTAALLVRALVDPSSVRNLTGEAWTSLLSLAHGERLIGTLADRLSGLPVPTSVADALYQASVQAQFSRMQALWEVEMARRALAPDGIKLILLKGSAFAYSDLPAAAGRFVGDLDIIVPQADLARAEAALLAAGWDWLKPDAYTDLYYRRWMHELPPLVHRDRGSMIDVHHTILPRTARRTPDAAALIAHSIEVAPGIHTLSPADIVVHAVTHLIADGDLAGGLRNLWDIDRLLRSFGERPDFWEALRARANLHQMAEPVARALRLTHMLYETPVDPRIAGGPRPGDRLFVRRLLARDGWGREVRPVTRLAFYIRSHWMRMPPLMLARHLWIKATGSHA